jgi:hypothetical protein
MRLPDVIHVGYSKAMSTWLQRLFREDGNIFYLRKSNFFIPYFDNYEKGIQHYQKYFVGSEKYRVVLESDEHLLMPGFHSTILINITNLDLITKTMGRIKNTLPGVKILVAIRNQVDMIISKYVQFVRRGGKLTVDAFLEEVLYRDSNYLKYCDYRYSEVIRILWDLFGEDKVYVLILEEFRKNAREILNEMSQFMGVNVTVKKQQEKRVNVSPSYYCLALQRQLNKVLVKRRRTPHTQAVTRVPFRIWIYTYNFLEFYDSILFKKKHRDKIIGPMHRSKIERLFSEDNKKLESLLDKSLQDMGYH